MFCRAVISICRWLGLAAVLLASAGAHAGAPPAGEPIPVVVTIPVLKDLVEKVGGSRVAVMALITGLESEHTYSPKPSDLVAVSKARILAQIGVGLEVWAQPLIKASGNPNLLVVTTSKGIALIREHEGKDVGLHAGDGSGDSHQEGNPHIWLDPENAKIMLRHLTEALISVDPSHSSEYQANQAQYLRRLDALEGELIRRMQTLSDRRIVVHHPAWPYFARRFKLEVVGEIVSQSGAEPSARHVQELIVKIRRQQVRVIVSEPQFNQRIPSLLAKETGAKVVVLNPLVGGTPDTDSYLDLLRYNVGQLASALAP